MKHSLAALLLVASLGPVWLRAEIVEQVLVKVNGEIFTKTDLEARQVAALRQMGQNVDPKSDMSDQQLAKMIEDVTPQLIVSVVDELLLIQRGRELGYKLADDQLQGILDNIKKENKIESEEQFQAALKQENMTLADLRQNLERQWIISRVQQNEVLGRIAVAEEEARAYYEANRAEFTSSRTVSLREILIAVPTDGNAINVARDETARSKAEQIRQRVTAGESFEKLAADMSDAPSKANAGLIGPLNITDLSPDIRKLLEPMKVGDVTQVLRTAGGYQLLKLESATSAQTQPFEQAREEIGNRVFTDKRRVEFEKYVNKLRSEAIIEFKNPEIKKAYDRGVEQAKTAPGGSF